MLPRIVRLRTALLAAALALPLAGCESPSGPSLTDRVALQRAKATWAAQGVDDYTMVVRTVCFCGLQEIRFTVVDGVVTERVTIEGGVPVPPDAYRQIESVDAMLDYIGDAIDEHADNLDIEYDTRGVPVNVFIDYEANAFDEEFGWGVKSLTITPA